MGPVGHPAEYADAVVQEMARRGYRTHVVVQRGTPPELLARWDARPDIRHQFTHRFLAPRKGSLVLEPLANSWHFYRDLRRALRVAGSDWVVFQPTCDHRYLLAWALWLLTRPAARAPRVILLLRFSYVDTGPDRRFRRDVRFARPALRILELAARKRRLHLATDSDRLAAEYAQLTRLPIHVLPIPHTRPDVAREKPPQAGKECLRVLIPGDARPEKGFQVAADAIRRLQAAGDLRGLEFIIQCHVTSDAHARMRDEALAGLDRAHVELVDEHLDHYAYHRLLASSDVVITPYWRGSYYSRTSGPFTEAVALGKVVVVTDDTWMSEQLAREEGGGLTFPDQDSRALADAIRRLPSEFPALARQARHAARAWNRYHSPASFADALLAL